MRVLLTGVLSWLLIAPRLALADEPTETAQATNSAKPKEESSSGINRVSRTVGEEGGVRPEVLEGHGGYGSAGCGLGSVIIKPSSHFVQVFAATTNGLFGNQTFGITSGTSNCAGPPSGTGRAQAFVVANRSALAVAAARGRGEAIDGLDALAACGDVPSLGTILQQNFHEIFPSASASDAEVSTRIVRVMRATPHLHCSALS